MLLVLLFQDERNEMENGRKKMRLSNIKEQKPLVQGLFQSSDQLDQSGLWTPSTPLNH